MSNMYSRFALFLLFFLGTTTAPAATGPFALLRSLFDPSTNVQVGAQQGYSVALDGNIAVVGAPSDDVGAYDSGVVKVYDATTGALMHTLTNPSPASSDHFGSAVSISGTRVVVGAYGDDSGATDAGSAYFYDLARATPTAPIVTITNPAPAMNDGFGFAVGISGTRIVVTAPRDANGSNYSGRAYIYDFAATAGPTPLLVVTNPSSTSNDRFGHAAAISGTHIVIGTRQGANGDLGQGNAYVYDFASASPALPVATLVNPGSSSSDYFGSAVGIFGMKVVIGAERDDTGALNAGVAHVYDLGSLSPSLPALTLTNPGAAANEYFGSAVAISGSHVAVGAVGRGRGYVFDLAAPIPAVPVDVMTNRVPASNDGFGQAAAISGTRVLFGALGDDAVATDAGSAYLYDLTSGIPSAPIATLNSSSPGSGRYFGRAVALSGTRFVVGTSPIGSGANQAVAYVYDFASASPTAPILILTNPTPQSSDFFGTAVGLHGTRVVIGAYGDDAEEIDAGRVFVYDLASATPAVPTLTLTNPTPARYDDYGYTVAISGTRVAVGTWQDDHGAEDAGTVYVYDLGSPSPAVPAFTLHNPNPSAGDWFGLAVGIDGTRLVVGAQRDDAGANDAGRAYVYDLAGANPTAPFVTMNNPNPAPQDFFGSSVAISGSRVVIGADWDAAGAPYSGSAYVYHLEGASPSFPLLTLTNPSPVVNDNFGSSVGISGTRVVIGSASAETGATDAGIAYVYDVASSTPAVPIAVLARTNAGDYDYFGGAVAIENDTIIVGARGVDTVAAARGAADIFVLRPTVSIAPAAPSLATLSWASATSSGWVLQYTDTLASTNWVNAPSGSLNPATISSTNAARFYRLSQP
jgi:hypothetical protein